MSAGTTSTPIALTPCSASARTSHPSPQPISSTEAGERLSTASMIASLVTRVRLAIWLVRTAIVHGAAFACQESTIRASFDESSLTGVARAHRNVEIGPFGYIVGHRGDHDHSEDE